MPLFASVIVFLAFMSLSGISGQTKQQRHRVRLYKPHAGQLKIHRSRARFRVVACGRRYGKTLMACNELARFALEHENTNNAWIAPFYRQSKIAYRLMRKALRSVIEHKSDSELRLELKNGSVITFFSAENHDAIRGDGFHFIVIDEAGDALRDPKVWTDTLRPTLSDRGGKALIIGTPKGRNLFYQLFCKGDDPLETEWESFTAPTSANPYIPKAEIEAVKREIPEDAFDQEYLARFLEEAAGVFKGVDRCIKGLLDPDYKKEQGHFYVVGWDPAKFQDYSVVSVIDCHTKRLVHWYRINQIDYTVQIETVARIAQEFGAVVYMDVTGVGAPLAEQLKAAGRAAGFQVEEYLFTNASKKILIEKLQLAIQHGNIEIAEIPVLINELRQFEYHRTPSGLISYEAPKGAHDDCVISLALSWFGASQPRGPIMWSIDDGEAPRSLEMPDIPGIQAHTLMEIERPFSDDEGIMIEMEAW